MNQKNPQRNAEEDLQEMNSDTFIKFIFFPLILLSFIALIWLGTVETIADNKDKAIYLPEVVETE